VNGHREIHRNKTRLDAVFARAKGSFENLEIQSDYARYLCVLVSGFFENAVVDLILDYTAKRSASKVSSFVESALDRWTNLNVEKLIQLLASFEPRWRDKASDFLVDSRKDHLNGLVALRHKVVHGESVGITISQIGQYYRTIVEIVEFVDFTLSELAVS